MELLEEQSDLLTLKEASLWASKHLGRDITTSNISYLVQYGRVRKIPSNSGTLISQDDLARYYHSELTPKENEWKEKLGSDLNWALSFDTVRESERTKHVHRLHPYKGKFIPQLVEYFLDTHTDTYKQESFFKPGDTVLDPFCGSGTTLVQASELGIHAIGVDVSEFNALISNAKVDSYDLAALLNEIKKISSSLKKYVTSSGITDFENELAATLAEFNNLHFPAHEYKYKVKNRLIDEEAYSKQKESEFLPIYLKLVEKHGVQLSQTQPDSFLGKWYLKNVRDEIDQVFELVKVIQDTHLKKIISIVLSRTIRSCRATTHSDLATLLEPMQTSYYCTKHGKICRPLMSILGWWERYSNDTIERLSDFSRLRTDTYQRCLVGDSRTIDIAQILEDKKSPLAEKARNKQIAGIFSSPPYVGLIDYHEQHAYAYELFGFNRNDEQEIGPLFKGKGKEAQKSYIQGISDVLSNSKKFLCSEANIFLVANDKHNLYPEIAEKSGMEIVNQFKRPVLNRTEKDKNAYSESIFHMRIKA